MAILRRAPVTEASNAGEYEKSDFQPISPFLSFFFGVAHAPFTCQRWGLPQYLALSGNLYNIGHSYYGIQIENRTQTFHCYHFQWPWVISIQDFKVTSLFDAECLGNGTIYKHSYSEILRDMHTPYSLVSLSFQTTLSDLGNIQWDEASRDKTEMQNKYYTCSV